MTQPIGDPCPAFENADVVVWRGQISPNAMIAVYRHKGLDEDPAFVPRFQYSTSEAVYGFTARPNRRLTDAFAAAVAMAADAGFDADPAQWWRYIRG